ncbi:MAG: hypothetical protein P8O23_09700 [Opitutales bacterium]|nr:hypothetical protein [Opitutales bacterium]
MKKSVIYSLTWLLSFIVTYATPEKPNLEDDVMPIFESKCNSCHNADRARGGLDLTNMNAILVGGSSGESVISGDGENSYLYKLIARVEKPYMPQREDKMPQTEIDLIKKWIDLGLLPSATGKAIQKKKSSVNLALGNVSVGKPDGPPPMPQYLSLEPSVVTERAFAPSAMASAPWSPLVAIAGQKQVLLYNTDTLQLMGVLPYPEGFIESLTFSRNGKLIVAGGGRGGKSGRVAAWEVESGKRLLTMGEEYDAILTADLSADQSLLAIGSPSKLVKVYDVASNELLYEIKKHSEWITQVAFSPDGILLATADRNGGLHIWEADTGNPFYTLDGHKEAITDLSWRADSNIIVSASEEGAVRTWEMINGKQAKTWNAHSEGTLSAYFDPKGNIVTAGRDKIVKLWQGDGKAISTIKDFQDIVIEVCYSHDGSRVIAGDWSGKVSVWNSSDGKKIGELNANPPELTTRIENAKEQMNQSKVAFEKALALKLPLAQVLKDAETALELERKGLSDYEHKSQAASQLVSTTEKDWKLAVSAVQNKIEDKRIKEKYRNETRAKLTQKGKELTLKKQSLDKWKKKVKDQTAHLSTLTQKYNHARNQMELNKGDSNFSKAFSNAESALKVIKSSFAVNQDHASKDMAELKKLSQVAEKLKLEVTSLEKSFASSITAFNTASKKKKEMDLLRNEKLNVLKELNSKVSEAKNKIALSQKHFEKAQNELKVPTEKFILAEKTLKSTQNEYARWKAEAVNIDRHVELRNLRNLQEEEIEFKAIISQAKELKKSAILAFENASKSLRDLPGKIAEKEKILASEKSALMEAEKGKVLIIQAREGKKSYISKVSQLALLAKKNSEFKEPNSILGEASTKFQETLALLRKDLAETENQLAEKEQYIQDTKEAVSKSESNLSEIIQLKESFPLLLKKKENSLAQTKIKEEETEKSYHQFKTRYDLQSGKTDALLAKYLELLPQ